MIGVRRETPGAQILRDLAPDLTPMSAISETIMAKPEHELIVAGDRSVAIEKLLKVLTYLQSQGVESANILMQDEDEK